MQQWKSKNLTYKKCARARSPVDWANLQSVWFVSFLSTNPSSSSYVCVCLVFFFFSSVHFIFALLHFMSRPLPFSHVFFCPLIPSTISFARFGHLTLAFCKYSLRWMAKNLYICRSMYIMSNISIDIRVRQWWWINVPFVLFCFLFVSELLSHLFIFRFSDVEFIFRAMLFFSFSRSLSLSSSIRISSSCQCKMCKEFRVRTTTRIREKSL